MDSFGLERSIEPRHALAQQAWKIDNTMTLRSDEVLIDVKIININLASFNEILDETGEDRAFLSGLPSFFVVAVCGFLMRFVPGIMMGYITVKTTTVSEFVAAMKKLHLPEQIIIPMSVIFRFFPTVVEEYNAIGDAMKMRGIRFGGGKAGAMLEYRLVPVIMCSVKIGEELSAAALTRGLGGSVKRTNICEIGFHVQDILFLLLCVVAFAIPIATMIAGR